jgi:hypothetical protein
MRTTLLLLALGRSFALLPFPSSSSLGLLFQRGKEKNVKTYSEAGKGVEVIFLIRGKKRFTYLCVIIIIIFILVVFVFFVIITIFVIVILTIHNFKVLILSSLSSEPRDSMWDNLVSDGRSGRYRKDSLEQINKLSILVHQQIDRIP